MQTEPTSALPPPQDSIFPVILVVAALAFNAGLAFVNANVMALGSSHVMLAEIVIVAAAQIYALMRFQPKMLPWYAFIALVGIFSVLRVLKVGEFDPKYFRDLLLIQTFVVLGMASNQRRAIQAMLICCALVLAGIVIEGVSLKLFDGIFGVKDFYINTRGLADADFTNKSSDLYVSATRPEGRYLPFFGLHRMSSIFLEPVSLGNFVLVLVGFTLAFWAALTRRQKWFALFCIVIFILACDGRQAVAGTAIILGMAVASRIFLPNITLFILPMVVIAAVMLVGIGDLHSGKDDVTGRLAYTVELLHKLGTIDYLGLSDYFVRKAADSGIVYLIITQSVVTLAILWILIVTSLEARTQAQADYKNSLCLYLALTMLVSYSFVSIKTAAPLWFIYGALASVPYAAARTYPATPALAPR